MVEKGVDITPANGKLGILLVGLGAVSTTFVAGVEAIRKGTGGTDRLFDADGNDSFGKNEPITACRKSRISFNCFLPKSKTATIFLRRLDYRSYRS